MCVCVGGGGGGGGLFWEPNWVLFDTLAKSPGLLLEGLLLKAVMLQIQIATFSRLLIK